MIGAAPIILKSHHPSQDQRQKQLYESLEVRAPNNINLSKIRNGTPRGLFALLKKRKHIHI